MAGIKTRALRQAPVGREFNRRMKIKFDELGIRFSPPPRLAYAMVPASGDTGRGPDPRGFGPWDVDGPAQASAAPAPKPSS